MSRRILAAIFLFSAALAGCAQDVGDINRVQPDYLKKTDFAGMWYLRDTVTRVPPTSSLLFAGYTGELEKIRWVITAKSLIAYRAYELIPGEDRNVDKAKAVNKTKVCDPLDGTRCTEYEGAPIAAYEITSHFDIKRDYKPETGEQLNVILENTEDRPWQEREFMRVNWSANQITNYTQLNSMLSKSGVVDLIRYVGQDSSEKNAVTIEHKADGSAAYVDFTGRYYINPVDCFYGRFGDCTAAEIEIRTSLTKVEDHDFEPLFYDDRMMTKFGFFRTERLTYDKDYGFTESGRIYLANRHNLWAQHTQPNPAFNQDLPASKANRPTVTLPLEQRAPKPIVYFLNPDFPKDTLEGAFALQASWDRAFRRVVAGAWGAPAAGTPTYDCSVVEEGQANLAEYLKQAPPKACADPFAAVKNRNGISIPRHMFQICPVPVTRDSPEACKMGHVIGTGPSSDSYFSGVAPQSWVPRVGDVRYNFLYWIPDPQLAGPLGYGPSSADPETGEIVSAAAYIYGAAIDTYAQSSLEIIDLLDGQQKLKDFSEGTNVADFISRNRDASDPRKMGEAMSKAILEKPASVLDREFLPKELKGKLDRIKVARLQALGSLDAQTRSIVKTTAPQQYARLMKGLLDRAPFNPADDRDERFAKALEQSDVAKRLLQADEIQNAIRASAPTEQGQKRTQAELLSNLAGELKRSEQRLAAAMKKDCVWLAEFSDDAVAGLAVELKKQLDGELAGIPVTDPLYAGRKQAAREKIRTVIKNRIFEAVAEHEIGHTMGLRHNFEGSYDSLNYFPQYWTLRKQNLKPLKDFGGSYDITLSDMLEMAQVTPAQRVGKMAEYKYSSIMDYGARFNSDLHGIGRYDEAAMLFAYAVEDSKPGLVEVFEKVPEASLSQWNNTGYTARTALADSENRPSPAHPALTEDMHYTRLPELFADDADWNTRLTAGVKAMGARRLAKYAEVQASRKEEQDALSTLTKGGTVTISNQQYLDLLNKRTFEVPYMFCSDEWVGARPDCQRWDEGADYREQTADLVDRYSNYYWFNNFKRDRLGWSSYGVLTRVFQRYFSYLPNSYQHWLYSQYGGSIDARQSRYWTMGVFQGYNLLSDVLATPSNGAYGWDETKATGARSNYKQFYCSDGTTPEGRLTCEDSYKIQGAQQLWYQKYRGASCRTAALPAQPAGRAAWLDYYGKLPQAEKDTIAVPHVEFYVYKGDGKPLFSRYDYNSGYFLFDKVQESGIFWDQLAAISALTASRANFLGVETQSDIRAYSIPYYLAFSESATDTFAGVYLEEYAKFAPRVKVDAGGLGTGFSYRVPEGFQWFDCDRDAAGSCRHDKDGREILSVKSFPAAPAASAPILETQVNWTQQIYSALYSMQFFTSASWSQSYADLNKIYLQGAGEQVVAGDGFEAVSFNDPFRGHVFQALSKKGVTDPAQLTPAALLIRKANLTLAKYEVAKKAFDLNDCDYAARDALDQETRSLENQIDFLNVMRSMYTQFGKNF